MSVTAPDIHGFLPLHYAAMTGQVAQINLLLQKAPNTLNAPSSFGTTPLFVAIQHGQAEAVKALIDANANLNLRLYGSYTPLLSALHEGNKEVIEQIIPHVNREQVNVSTEDKITPLMLACELNDPALVNTLIEKGADINAKDKQGYTALDTALRHQSLPIIQHLQYTNRTTKIFQSVARYANQEIANFLDRSVLARHLHAPCEGTDVLIECVKAGNVSTALEFIGGVSCSRETGEKILRLAIQNHFHSVTDKLLEIGLVLDEEESLRYIEATGNPILIEKLLTGDLSQASKKRVFIAALKHKHPDIAKLLHLLHTPSENRPGILGSLHLKTSDKIWHLPPFLKELEQGDQGQSLAQYLVQMDEPYLLMDNVDDPLGFDRGNQPSLSYMAAEKGNNLSFQKLLDLMEAGRIPFDNQYRGRHILYGAFESFQDDIIDTALCHFQRDINILLDRSTGVTAAHLAARQNNVTILERIEDYRGKFNARDSEDHSPLFYAIASGSTKAVDFLLSRDCSINKEVDIKKAQQLPKALSEKILKRLVKAGDVLPPLEQPAVEVIEDNPELALFHEAVERNNTQWILANGNDLPLEQTLPANKTKRGKPLPLIFDLINRSINQAIANRLLTVEQLSPLIRKVQQEHPNLQDSEGNTLSHYLVQLEVSPDMEVLEAIAQNFNIRAKNKEGMTPVHIASIAAPPSTFAWLLTRPNIDLEVEDTNGNTPLFCAVENGNNAYVAQLLSMLKGANPDHRNHLQITPAFYAAHLKKTQVLKTLLEYCDIEKYVSNEKITLLHILAEQDPDGMFIEALTKAPTPTCSEDRRKGVAHILAKNGSIKALRFFLHRDKPSLMRKDENGYYPWDIAALKGNIEVLRFYQEEHPDLFTANHRGEADKLLMLAAEGGQTKTAQHLIDQGVLNHMDPSQRIEVLKSAARSNFPETLKLFTKIFITGEKEDFLAMGVFETLPSAVALQSTNSLNHFYNELGFPQDWELMHEGFPVGTGMQIAAMHGALKTTRWLIENGAEPDEVTENKKEHILELAAAHKSIHQFRYLLESVHFDINYQNSEKQTLLHIAATHGNLDHVALLLDKGWNPNIPDYYGLTALERAVVGTHADIARVLMLCGADDGSIQSAKRILEESLDTKVEKNLELYKETAEMFRDFQTVLESNPSFNPLHIAIKLNCKVSTLFLSKTLLLNQADNIGSTPLHWTVLEDNLPLARILINNGASLESKNSRGKTPLGLAEELHRDQCVTFLSALSRGEAQQLAEEVV